MRVRNCYFSEVQNIERLVDKDEEVEWGARRKRNSCQPGRLHKHTLGRSRQTQTDRFSHWTHTPQGQQTISVTHRCKRTHPQVFLPSQLLRYGRRGGCRCIPGTAKGHQSVLVVDSHASAVSHVCCPDALQLLYTHTKKPFMNNWMCVWCQLQVSRHCSTCGFLHTLLLIIFLMSVN